MRPKETVAETINEGEAPDAKARILEVASAMIARGGITALTTRAVAAAASTQAPTLYRLFGDKRGMLDALAERGLNAFVAEKAREEPHSDPVQNLRDAWDAFVHFGLHNPAVFAIMNEVGRSGPQSPAALTGKEVLRTRVRRIAQAGRLLVQEQRAVDLIEAACSGTVAKLLTMVEADRDPELSSLALEAVLNVLVDGHVRTDDIGPAAFAVGLNAHLDNNDVLTPGERMLMRELLERLSAPEIARV